MEYGLSETLSPIYGFDSTDSISTVVDETPMVGLKLDSTDFKPSMPVETPDVEFKLDSELIVPDTPDAWVDSELYVPDTPDAWLDSELIVPESPGYEFVDSTVEPEPRPLKRQRRPVEEEEWFRDILLILLPGMKDLL